MNILGFSGSLTAPSRTTALVSAIATTAGQALHARTELSGIAELVPDLGRTLSPQALPAPLQATAARLAAADLLVIGSPVYKASYTGLFKHFFDLLDPDCLRGKVAILVATGGSDHHALMLEYQLRPLLAFFGVHTVPTALFARDSAFAKDAAGDYRLADDALQSRIRAAVGQAAELLGGFHAPARQAA